MPRTIYFDYNATTPLDPAVRDAMLPFLDSIWGNPSSVHAVGRRARALLDDARDRAAMFLGTKPSELIFTSGGTESNNLAVFGAARSRQSRGKHLITSAIEHHAVLHGFDYLEKKEGFRVTRLPVDGDGRVSVEAVKRALRPDTVLVSIMAANNEIGTIQPVAEIGALCREKGVVFHTDAVQWFGKEPVASLDQFNADLVSVCAHKFHGPKGAGVLYLRASLSIERLQHGGSHENERRPGTENTAAIVGMAVAAELACASMEAERPRQAVLRERLWHGIREAFPSAVRNGGPDDCLANTLNVSFPGLDGESLLINLDLAGICASSGSACMVGSIVPSHVLLAMGVAPELARSTVRFSLGNSAGRRGGQ